MFSITEAPETNPPTPRRGLLMSLSYGPKNISQTDYNLLPSQDLRSYLLCSQQPAVVGSGQVHQHQHQHTHDHTLTPLLHPSLAISPAPFLMRTQQSNTTQSFVPFNASPRTSQGLIQPKPGKWGAMHVCIAWQIHRHKQIVEKTPVKPEFLSFAKLTSVIQDNRDRAHSSSHTMPGASHGRSASSPKRPQPPLHLAALLKHEEEGTEGKEEATRVQPRHTDASQRDARAALARQYGQCGSGHGRESGGVPRKRGLPEGESAHAKAKRTRQQQGEPGIENPLLPPLRRPSPSPTAAAAVHDGSEATASSPFGGHYECGDGGVKTSCPAASAWRPPWGRLNADHLERGFSVGDCERSRAPEVECGHTDYDGCHVFKGKKMLRSVKVSGPQYYQPFPAGYYATVVGLDPNAIYPTPSFAKERFVQQNQHVFSVHQTMFMNKHAQLQDLAGQPI